MPDHEQAAVDAAADALHDLVCTDPACAYAMHSGAPTETDLRIAARVLQAARPHITGLLHAERLAASIARAVAAERERIAQLAEQYRVGCDVRRGAVSTWTLFADLIRSGGDHDD